MTIFSETMEKMIKMSNIPTEQKKKLRDELLYVYLGYKDRYTEFADKQGRPLDEFPTYTNKSDLIQILFPNAEYFFEDCGIGITDINEPLTCFAGVKMIDSMQAVIDYSDISQAYGIPCHIEFSKENLEKHSDGYCRAWYFFEQGVEAAKIRQLIKRMLAEADLPERSSVFTGELVNAHQFISAIPDFCNILGDDALFVEPKTFSPYETWDYLLKVVSEEALDDRNGMVKPEWIDQALEVNEAPLNKQPEVVSSSADDLDEDSVNEFLDALAAESAREAKSTASEGSKEATDVEPFDENTVRKFFRRLDHSNYGLTELVVYSPQTNRILASGFFKDENRFIKSCCQYDGIANIYAGKNPRPFDFAEDLGLETDKLYTDRKSRASDRDIEWLTAMVLDIDPVRPKGTSSTDVQHQAALAFAEKVAEDIGGSIDSSGNGSYVWIALKPVKINDEYRETIKAKCRGWEAQIRERYQTEDCGMKIDPVFELSRILKVIGTMSVKGEIHRRSKFHTPPVFEPHPTLDQTILNIPAEIKAEVNIQITAIENQLPEKFNQLIKNDECLSIHWDAPNRNDDASAHDWRLGMLCLDNGISDPNELATIISLNPYGKIKKKGRDDGYIRVTVSELLKQWEPRTATTNPKEIIGLIVSSTKSKYEQKSRISRFIYQDLQKRGEFIRTRNEHFYFMMEDKKLMEIPDSIDFKAFLNSLYDLVETEQYCQFILAELKAKCHLHGRETIVHKFAFFDKSAFKLYIDRFDGRIYLLDGDQIRLADNGVDGILFAFDELAEAYEISDPGKGDLFNKYIAQRINLEANSDADITVKEQRLLCYVWIWNMFFESISPTKPLLLLYGPKGSGKTSIAKAIGKLLFGSKFDVSSVSDDQRDFDALLSNKYLIVLDNLDVRKPWLTDRLAKAATGQAIEMRELYTTNNLARYFPKCYIIITARTPQIRQDDVADRLLILNVKRFENFIPESTLLNDVLENRNAILSELLHQLNWCIKRLKENRDKEYTGNFRMADFANFGYKIFNESDVFIETLRKMDRAQNEFLLEEDTLLEFLNLWLDKPNNQNRAVKALELLSELNRIANEQNIEFPFKSPMSLSMRLRNQEKNLQQYFKFTIDIAPGRANLFRFAKKDSMAK
jgi:hypothetical protein